MPLADRLLLNSPREGFFGVDRYSAVNSLGLGHFFSTENVVPDDSNGLTRRLGADEIVSSPPAAITDILATITFNISDEGGDEEDELLLVASRDGDTDALYKFNNTTGLTLIAALAATGADYDLVQFTDQVFIFDGTNDPQVYDGDSMATLTGTNIPSAGQYGTVFQDRLIVAVPTTGLTWFSNVLDETTFASDAFLNAKTAQTGDEITGVGVNSPTSGKRLAQEDLAVFGGRSVFIFSGTLGNEAAQFHHRSSKVGLFAHKTLKNTPHGLMFLGNAYFGQDNSINPPEFVSVFLLPIGAREPLEVGAPIRPVLSDLTKSQMDKVPVAVCDRAFYKLAVPSGASAVNDTEWWLDLRLEHFQVSRRWFGPHTGNEIGNYAIYRDALWANKAGEGTLWRIDEDDGYQYMEDESAREWKLVSPSLGSPDLRNLLWEAFSVDIETAATSIDVDFESESETTSVELTLGTSNRTKAVFRPRKRRRTMKTTIRGGDGATDDFTIEGLHWRMRPVRRQAGMD